MVFPMKFTKTVQYSDARNDTREAVNISFFPGMSHEKLLLNSTMMLQMTRVSHLFMVFPIKFTTKCSTMLLQMRRLIWFAHGISHWIHQNSSVLWSYKWPAVFQFSMAKQLSTLMKVTRFCIQSVSAENRFNADTKRRPRPCFSGHASPATSLHLEGK